MSSSLNMSYSFNHNILKKLLLNSSKRDKTTETSIIKLMYPSNASVIINKLVSFIIIFPSSFLAYFEENPRHNTI